MENPISMKHLKLGAPIYMPAARQDLAAIGNGLQLPQARCVIFCTEDAILDRDLPQAMEQLKISLPMLEGTGEAAGGTDPVPFRCIRPRSPEILRRLLDLDGTGSINGFVLPKVNSSNLRPWLKVVESRP